MMSDKFNGVDSSFSHGKVTPFVSDTSKIIRQVQKEVARRESNRSLLLGPKTSGLGPEKGRLDRLHTAFVIAKAADNGSVEEAKDRLLAEVERYARRITLGKGGKYAQRLNHSATDAYPQTEVSTNTAIKVWLNLDKFDSQSKFTTWVFRIAQNVIKDSIRQIRRRGEVDLLTYKGYRDYAGSRGATSQSTNGEFAITGGSKTPLPRIYGPVKLIDPTEHGCSTPSAELSAKLDELIERLPKQDKKIIQMFRRGSTPAEIGRSFKKNAKWASNALTRIKGVLKELSKSLANDRTSNVLVLEGVQTLPASEAAD